MSAFRRAIIGLLTEVYRLGFNSILRGGLLSALITGIAPAPAHSFQTINNAKDDIRDPLRLTTHVVSAKYLTSRASAKCNSRTTPSKSTCTKLVLELRLRFKNVSNKIVKVDKYCMLLDSVVVYDSPLVGPPEPLLPDGMISDSSEGCIYRPDEKLMRVPPGASWESSIRVKFDVIDRGPAHPPESLAPGRYSLQIEMGTWWEIDGQDEDSRAKRKLPGIRSARSVYSQLMPFVVEREPINRRTSATVPCSGSCFLDQAG